MSPEVPQTPAAADTVIILPATLSLDPGDSALLAPQVVVNGVGATPTALQWTSATPSVASVDAHGMVHASSTGVTAITAKSGTATATAIVTVRSVLQFPNVGTIKPGQLLTVWAVPSAFHDSTYSAQIIHDDISIALPVFRLTDSSTLRRTGFSSLAIFTSARNALPTITTGTATSILDPSCSAKANSSTGAFTECSAGARRHGGLRSDSGFAASQLFLRAMSL